MTWIRALGTIAPTFLSLAWFDAPTAPPRIPLTMTLAASSVVGGISTTATITLATVAPTGGTVVTVTNPIGTTVQAGANQVGTIQTQGSTKVNIAAGQRQVTINILTFGVATTSVATLTAISGTDEAAAALVINPASPRSLILAQTSVTGGQSASVTVVLDGAAPAGTGVTIPLSVVAQVAQNGTFGDGSVRLVSASPASVPATIHFPPGASSAIAQVTTTAVVQDQSVTIRATLGAATASGTLVIKAPVVVGLTLAAPIVMVGSGTTGTVALNGPAPANGKTVGLSANNLSAAVPRAVAVPAGATTASFPVTTSAQSTTGGVVSVVIAASGSQTTSLTSITDGTSNTIQLGETRPPASATLTVLPAVVLQSTSVAPATVTGGDPMTLSLTTNTGAITVLSGSKTITFGGAAPIVAGTATIAVDQPALVQLPSSVTIPSGGGVITVKGTTSAAAADATVTIKTVFGATTTTSTLLIKAPVSALASFTARPTTVTGGNNLIVSFTLSPAISSATVVTLSTDRPDLIQVPSSVTVPVSVVPMPLTFKTQPVTAQTTATITATAGAQRLPVTITLVPAP
jgi:hypothetical protein